MCGPKRCSKCGEWMTMQIEYIHGNPNIAYRCSNGCQTESYNGYGTSNYTTTISTSRYCSKRVVFVKMQIIEDIVNLLLVSVKIF